MCPLEAAKECTMIQYVFRRQWELTRPEEAFSHMRRCTMAAVRPGNGSLSC